MEISSCCYHSSSSASIPVTERALDCHRSCSRSLERVRALLLSQSEINNDYILCDDLLHTFSTTVLIFLFTCCVIFCFLPLLLLLLWTIFWKHSFDKRQTAEETVKLCKARHVQCTEKNSFLSVYGGPKTIATIHRHSNSKICCYTSNFIPKK